MVWSAELKKNPFHRRSETPYKIYEGVQEVYDILIIL